MTLYDYDGSLDVVTHMLKLFHLDLYGLIDMGDTLYFWTPYVAMRFHLVPIFF